jgi:hypothetical protein
MPAATPTLARMAMLNVSRNELLQKEGHPYVKSIATKLARMLYQTENVLSFARLSTVPYDKLSVLQLALLSTKGFASREAYESTPLNGRFYAFGPRDVFAQMIEGYGMSVLFEEKLIQDAYWLAKWEAYTATSQNEEAVLAASLDEQDYFLVYLFAITMPDSSTRGVQVAARDFPADLTEAARVQRVVEKLGAASADMIAYTEEGYDPVLEIITFG